MKREDKVRELNKKTLKLLELTKKQMSKYALERKKIFEFSCKSIDGKIDVEKWEEEISKIEEELHCAV